MKVINICTALARGILPRLTGLFCNGGMGGNSLAFTNLNAGDKWRQSVKTKNQ